MTAARRNFESDSNDESLPSPKGSIKELVSARSVDKPDPQAPSLQNLVTRQAALIEAITHALDCDDSDQSTLHIASMLQSAVRCTDVFLSVLEDEGLELAATSSLSNVDTRSTETTLIRLAMQEAIDQDSVTMYPLSNNALAVTDAHERLVNGRTNTHLLTIPLIHREKVIGAVLFRLSKQAPWDVATREFAEQLCAGVAPVLALHKKASVCLATHMKRSLQARLASILGPSRITLKCFGALAALTLVLMAVIPVERTIRADAEISPTSLHVVSSPASGFIESINIRSGDVVHENQLLLTLDTRDLILQAQRKQVEIDRLSAEYRGAMADHDRKAMAIAQAKLDRARAEQELAELELSRADIRAPHAGFVIGDALTKATGAPINRGDVLLQIAPSTGNEVHLLVDEADIADVKAGLIGQIALKSAPGEPLDIVVDAVRPIAESADGATRFRVVASVEAESGAVLPGQTGVAHLVSEKRSALKVATWRISRWFSERFWIIFG